VLADPKALENPFFLLYPDWAQLPMVVLATVASVIASQAVITGAYSLTRQAIALGLLAAPRDQAHLRGARGADLYAADQYGLLVGVLAAGRAVSILGCASSAYGVAVTGTMVVTGHHGLRRGAQGVELVARRTVALIAPIVLVDATFLTANLFRSSKAAGCRWRLRAS